MITKNGEVDALKWLEKEVGPMTFGRFLRACRTSLGVTQVEMGKKIGVSKAMISDIERGRQLVSPKLAQKIARKAQLSERQAVRLCLQDQLDKAKIKMKVTVVS